MTSQRHREPFAVDVFKFHIVQCVSAHCYCIKNSNIQLVLRQYFISELILFPN